MRKRHLWLVLALATVILAAGVSPLMAWDYKGYVKELTSSKPFPVYSDVDTYCEVWFKWDAPCTLLIRVTRDDGMDRVFDLRSGPYVKLKGGGTYTVYVVSKEGNCNWEATIAELFSGGPYKGNYGGPLVGGGSSAGYTNNGPDGKTTPVGGTTGGGSGGGSVTDLEGESPKGTADCAGLIWDRVSMDTPADVTVYAKIDENCVPGMVCFTVGAGLYAEIDSSYFKSNGYNCATGAYIEDPGFVVVEGCCSEKVLFTRDYDKNHNAHDTGRSQFYGPGKFTLQPSGGRNLMLKVEFNVYKQ